MKWLLLAIPILLLVTSSMPAQNQRQHSDAYLSMEKKIAYLEQNAAKKTPDPNPTELTEAEVNAYFDEGGVKLPTGVSNLKLTAQPAVIDGHAKVDFDVITQKARSANPLLGVFSGVHDVRVVAQANGASGSGSVRVQNVYLDGVEVPPIALQFFADRYLKPKYPNVGMNSTFPLPLRIDTAIVDSGRVRLFQK